MDNNLTLTNYGVTLKRLTHDKIEMLRQWRNDPAIRQNMVYKEIITPEMQERWFANLDLLCNYYFIVDYKGTEIGMVHIKNIDYAKKNGENGIIIYNEKFRSTDIPYRALLVMCDWFFVERGFDYTYSHVLTTNPASIRLGEFMGFVKDTKNSTDEVQMWNLTRDSYLLNVNRLRFVNKWNKLNQ